MISSGNFNSFENLCANFLPLRHILMFPNYVFKNYRLKCLRSHNSVKCSVKFLRFIFLSV